VILMLVGLGLQWCVAQNTITPTVSDARQTLQQRIEQQAEGRIKLVSFKSNASPKAVPWDTDGRRKFLVTYEAEIEFTEPCVWETQYEEKPGTFKTYKLNTLEPVPGRVFRVPAKGERFTLQGQIALQGTGEGWEATSFFWSDPPERTVELNARRRCQLNLEQLGNAFRRWSGEHKGQFPFNVSTNAGGTRELSVQGPNGCEQNPGPPFQAIAPQLPGPETLMCPAGAKKSAATSFEKLRFDTVSYRLQLSTNSVSTMPPAGLVHCPFHNLTLCTDGSVTKGQP